MKRRGLGGLIAIGACVAASCDPVASNKYEGEVLATIHGLVVNDQSAGQPSPPPLELALIWGSPDGNAFKLIAEKVPVAGKFPAEFTLELHQPPPAEAGVNLGGAHLSQAFLAALETSDWKQGTLLPKGRNVLAYGVANEMLFHLDKDLAATDPLAILLGGIQKAGFHLVEPVALSAEEFQRRAAACRQVAPPDQADACSAHDADAQPTGLHEVTDGLAHRISLPVSWEYLVLSGGDDPEEPSPGSGDLSGSGASGGSGGSVPPRMSADGGAANGMGSQGL